VKKTVFTLNVNGFSPEITAITYPLIKYWAHKIGAGFHVITERKFPEWPVTYEKLQVFELARQMGNDWNIYVDSDAIIHPETLDWTAYIPRDTVAHNGHDMANIRWRYDRYFLRDGRNIGSCNWMTIASDWCADLWRPLDDLSPDQAIDNISPTVDEYNTVITAEHLIDDYTLSRNIARFGLKFKPLKQIIVDLGMPEANFFWHAYTVSAEDKIKGYEQKQPDGTTVHVPGMLEILDRWKIPEVIRTYG
jgi:hypothetical protein